MSGGVFVHAVLAKSFTLITKQRLAHSRYANP